MIIDHPLLGPRDISEFIYLGDSSLLNRPNWDAEESEHSFYKYYIYEKMLLAFIKNFGFINKETDHGLLSQEIL